MAWIAVIGALASAAAASEASKDAAGTMAGAAGRAQDSQLAIYNQQRADQRPYQTVGQGALWKLAGGAGIANPQTAPAGYQSFDQWVSNAGYQPPIGRSWNADEMANLERAYQQYKAAPALLPFDQWTRQAGYARPEGRGWNEQELANLQAEYQQYAAQAAPQVAQPTPDAASPGMPADNPLTRRFSLADLEADPVYQRSYQAGLDMGQKQLTASLGARGVLNSGGAAKALTRYASDYTAQRGNEAFNRFQVGQGNERNFLSSLAGIGQQSVNQVGAAGANYANNASNLAMQAGTNAAAGQISQGNIWGGAVQGIGNWYQNQSTLDRLMAERERDRLAYGRTSAAPASGPLYDWQTGWGVQ